MWRAGTPGRSAPRVAVGEYLLCEAFDAATAPVGEYLVQVTKRFSAGINGTFFEAEHCGASTVELSDEYKEAREGKGVLFHLCKKPVGQCRAYARGKTQFVFHIAAARNVEFPQISEFPWFIAPATPVGEELSDGGQSLVTANSETESEVPMRSGIKRRRVVVENPSLLASGEAMASTEGPGDVASVLLEGSSSVVGAPNVSRPSNAQLHQQLEELRKKLGVSPGSDPVPLKRKSPLDSVLSSRMELGKRSVAHDVARSSAGEAASGSAQDKLAQSMLKAFKHVHRKQSDDDSSSSGECLGGSRDSTVQPDVSRVFRKHPGKLATRVVSRMMELIGDRLPPNDMETELKPVVTAYLHTVLFTNQPREKMGLRNARELQTLAMASDLIIRGQVSSGLDVLLQRWKAIEKSLVDGNWGVARWLELIPNTDMPLASREETRAALKAEKAEKESRSDRK